MSIRDKGRGPRRCGGNRSRNVPCHYLAPGKVGGLLATNHYVSASRRTFNDAHIVPYYLIAKRTTKVTTTRTVGRAEGSIRGVSASCLEGELGRRKRLVLWCEGTFSWFVGVSFCRAVIICCVISRFFSSRDKWRVY